MSTPSTPETDHDPGAPLTRHEADDGTVYWGDVDAGKFARASERFPVLKFVIEDYFGSPERQSRDTEFLVRYEEIGEESAEFNGFLEDLDTAIKQYSLATTLVNGLMGVNLASTEVRTQLTSLKDQVQHQGDFRDSDPEEDAQKDPWMLETTPDRLQASFFYKRALIPVGSLKDKPLPMYYYILASILLILVGLGISYIPFIGGLGTIFMVIGAILCFLLAVATLSMRSDYINPERERQREEKRRELAEKKKEKEREKENKRGVFSKLNPFGN